MSLTFSIPRQQADAKKAAELDAIARDGIDVEWCQRQIELAVQDANLREAQAAINTLAHECDVSATKYDALASIAEERMVILWSQRRELAAHRVLLRDLIPVTDESHRIEDVVSRVVELRRSGDGGAYVGRCPFCDDGIGLHVLPAFGRFACAACRATGDAFDFASRWSTACRVSA